MSRHRYEIILNIVVMNNEYNNIDKYFLNHLEKCLKYKLRFQSNNSSKHL